MAAAVVVAEILIPSVQQPFVRVILHKPEVAAVVVVAAVEFALMLHQRELQILVAEVIKKSVITGLSLSPCLLSILNLQAPSQRVKRRA